MLHEIVACGISLRSNAAHASQSPQSKTSAGRRSQGRLTESAVITHAQHLQSGVDYLTA